MSGVSDDVAFDAAELTRADFNAVKRALSRFSPPVEASAANVRRYFLVRASKVAGERVMRQEVGFGDLSSMDPTCF